MKKTVYIAFTLIISVVYNACTSSTSVDESIGRKTFELLQKLDTISSADFSTHFLSLEELRTFIKDTTVQDTFRNAIALISEEKHQERIQQAYEMLKESGKKFTIDWNKITFEDYVYQIRSDSGVEFHDGFVIFTHDSTKYLAKMISFEFKGEQCLFILSNFEPVSE